MRRGQSQSGGLTMGFLAKNVTKHVKALVNMKNVVNIGLRVNHKIILNGNNVQFNNAPRPKPVYAYLHPTNVYWSIHFEPAWAGELLGTPGKRQVQFYAYEEYVPGTTAVYAYWHSNNVYWSFHFAPEWSGEKVREPNGRAVQFYAYEKHVRGTKPVYAYWHPTNVYWSFHFEPAWEGEVKGKPGGREVQFYAFDKMP